MCKIRKNLFKIRNKKLLLSSAILAFFTGITTASTPSTELEFNHQISLDKFINTTPINVIADGLIYVAKVDDQLNFWSLSPDDLVYTLVKVEDMTNATNGQLIINMEGSLTGLFYSDNLFDNPNLKVIFKSQMKNGKIALPIDHEDFEKLSVIVNQLNQPVNALQHGSLQELVLKKTMS